MSDGDSPESIASTLAALGFSNVNENARRLALINVALPIIGARSELKNGVDAISHLNTLGRLLDFLETIACCAAYLALLTEYLHTF